MELWQACLSVYLFSGLIVALGLLWLHDEVYTRMQAERRLHNPLRVARYLAMLLALVITPVVNTLCVLFAVVCLWRAAHST